MTGLFERLLLPTDGSEAVGPAVDLGIDLAEAHEATLHVLYVVNESSVVGYDGSFASWDTAIEELERTGEQTTDDIATRAADRGVETTTAVQRGTPRHDILSYAAEHDIDLILMGTHGRTGLTRALIGSVTESVVRHSSIPVLTIGGGPDGND